MEAVAWPALRHSVKCNASLLPLVHARGRHTHADPQQFPPSNLAHIPDTTPPHLHTAPPSPKSTSRVTLEVQADQR